jgi:subtilisin family serine protease
MKRGICLVIALCILFTLSLNTQPALSQSESGEVTRDTPFVPGQVIVGFDESVAVKAVPAQAAALAGEVQAAVLKVSGSTALLEFAPDADVEWLAAQLQEMYAVKYAEPNFIFWLPENVEKEHEANNDFIVRKSKDGEDKIIPISVLQSMKKRTGSTTKALYPNDPGLWSNNGWWSIGANIVFPNTTPSKNVCVIDTGVDHTHPELLYRVILGKDFVNNDNGPMDDHGHGTHVAGIITAKQNNKQGMAGVSTGKVIAVKALSAQGYGTSYDVAQSIYYCANRSDAAVINLSLGGGYSQMMFEATDYAVNTKGKLLVASAGNAGSTAYNYPAAFSVNFPNQVLSVAASGAWVGYDWDEDGEIDDWGIDNYCKADYSNYGEWVDIAAPGTSIYSTVPWKKPYYMSGGWYSSGYEYLSGTSMAAPFVSAVAARAWGYIPSLTNIGVSEYLKETGDWSDPIWAPENCWPESMSSVRMVNVAAVLQRGAVYAYAYDANTGLPLTGANVTAYRGGSSRGSAQITPSTFNSWGTTYSYFNAGTDIVNLPAGNNYHARVSKSGYTAVPQAAFINYQSYSGTFTVWSGGWSFAGEAFVPPRSTNFTGVYHTMEWEDNSDLYTFLPNLPKPEKDDGQPAPFVVSMNNGWSSGYWEGEATGSLAVFPFARQMMEGSWMWNGWDSTVIRSKPGVPAVPYYTGTYSFAVVNGDSKYSSSFFIWKDGTIKKRVDRGSDCSGLWWRPLSLSQKSGAAVYTEENYCGSGNILPYPIPGFSPEENYEIHCPCRSTGRDFIFKLLSSKSTTTKVCLPIPSISPLARSLSTISSCPTAQPAWVSWVGVLCTLQWACASGRSRSDWWRWWDPISRRIFIRKWMASSIYAGCRSDRCVRCAPGSCSSRMASARKCCAWVGRSLRGFRPSRPSCRMITAARMACTCMSDRWKPARGWIRCRRRAILSLYGSHRTTIPSPSCDHCTLNSAHA